MYNKKKYLAHKIGSVCSIILGVLILISLLFTIFSVFKVCDKIAGSGLLGLMIGLALRAYLGVIFIKFGYSTMEKPTFYKSEDPPVSYWIYPSAKQTVTLIILGALLFILGLAAGGAGGVISSSGSYSVSIKVLDWAQWIQNLLALGVAVLKIVALVIPGTGTELNDTQKTEENEDKKDGMK